MNYSQKHIRPYFDGVAETSLSQGYCHSSAVCISEVNVLFL